MGLATGLNPDEAPPGTLMDGAFGAPAAFVGVFEPLAALLLGNIVAAGKLFVGRIGA